MSPALLYALGALAFVVALMVSIGLHELGHMYFAKRFGARVSQYFIGFGPTLWSRQKGETEYGIKALPLGGFVRIIGMIPPAEPAREGEVEKVRKSDTGLFTGLISAARKTEAEEVKPEDADRLFYKLNWRKKLVVMGTGPAVNIGLAFLCFLGVFATLGSRSYDVPDGAVTLAFVSPCVAGAYAETVSPAPDGTCSRGEESPASLAGLKSGDVLTEVNGREIKSWDEVIGLVKASSAGDEVVLTYLRDGSEREARVSLIEALRPSDADPNQNVRVGYLGVSPVAEEVWTRHGPLYTLNYMGERTIDTFRVLKEVPAKLWNVSLALAGLEERDPNGPVSLVGGARFSGEVAAYENGTIEGVSFTTGQKVGGFFMLVGIFNLFLGVFNFLPILPLDGGHMAGAVWEGIKRRWAALRNRPMPGPVDVAKALPIAYVFGATLFLMGILLITADIFVPLRLLG